jgi:hypothetical protein
MLMSVLGKYLIFVSSYVHCDVKHKFLVIVPLYVLLFLFVISHGKQNNIENLSVNIAMIWGGGSCCVIL